MKRRYPSGAVRELLNAAHAKAMRMEPTAKFPGVDIDAIHYKRGAMQKPLRKAA